MSIENLRNIGISAHIDSGKTTLSERILFYAGRLHRMEEVHDGGGATMDHMDLEQERGITITSAATCVDWGDHQINLIDTPGHVDFTVEVERSLRVLDGAVLVLCGVGGVQSQSLTVDRQIKRYGVPRVIFINKLDRTGADPVRVCEEVRSRLGVTAVLMQLPIGLGDDLEGVVDLVTMQSVYFDGNNGEELRREAIPESMQDEAAVAREEMLEQLAMFDDELMELCLEDQDISEEIIPRSIWPSRRSFSDLPIATRVSSPCWMRSLVTCPRPVTARPPPSRRINPQQAARPTRLTRPMRPTSRRENWIRVPKKSSRRARNKTRTRTRFSCSRIPRRHWWR